MNKTLALGACGGGLLLALTLAAHASNEAGIGDPAPAGGTRLFRTVQAPAGEAGEIFHGEGIVTAVEPFGRVTIDGPIAKLMPTMNMKYKVRPPELSAGLQPGDKVEFDVDSAYTIVGVKVVEHKK